MPAPCLGSAWQALEHIQPCRNDLVELLVLAFCVRSNVVERKRNRLRLIEEAQVVLGAPRLEQSSPSSASKITFRAHGGPPGEQSPPRPDRWVSFLSMARPHVVNKQN